MAIFGKTKKKTEIKEAKKLQYFNVGAVLIRPHMTEKAVYATERGVYVFEITPHANKKDVMRAIRALYAVSPTKVAIVKSKPTLGSSRISRGKKTMTSGSKKAYVYLKKGDKIDLV